MQGFLFSGTPPGTRIQTDEIAPRPSTPIGSASTWTTTTAFSDELRVVQLISRVGKFVFFSDPDGNGRAVQEIRPEE